MNKQRVLHNASCHFTKQLETTVVMHKLKYTQLEHDKVGVRIARKGQVHMA